MILTSKRWKVFLDQTQPRSQHSRHSKSLHRPLMLVRRVSARDTSTRSRRTTKDSFLQRLCKSCRSSESRGSRVHCPSSCRVAGKATQHRLLRLKRWTRSGKHLVTTSNTRWTSRKKTAGDNRKG